MCGKSNNTLSQCVSIFRSRKIYLKMKMCLLFNPKLITFHLFCQAQYRGRTKFHSTQEEADWIDPNVRSHIDNTPKANYVREISPNVYFYRNDNESSDGRRLRLDELTETDNSIRNQSPRSRQRTREQPVLARTKSREQTSRASRQRHQALAPTSTEDAPSRVALIQRKSIDNVFDFDTEIEDLYRMSSERQPVTRRRDPPPRNTPNQVAVEDALPTSKRTVNQRRHRVQDTNADTKPTVASRNAVLRNGRQYQSRNANNKVASSTVEPVQRQSQARRPLVKTTAPTPTTDRPQPISRGTVRSKSTETRIKSSEINELLDENYPEHFKLLLKAKVQDTIVKDRPKQEINQIVAIEKKPVKAAVNRVSSYRRPLPGRGENERGTTTASSTSSRRTPLRNSARSFVPNSPRTQSRKIEDAKPLEENAIGFPSPEKPSTTQSTKYFSKVHPASTEQTATKLPTKGKTGQSNRSQFNTQYSQMRQISAQSNNNIVPTSAVSTSTYPQKFLTTFLYFNCNGVLMNCHL